MGFVDYNEQRDYIRMDMDCIIKFRIKNETNWQEAEAKNLSAIGVQIVTKESLEMGAIIEVVVTPGTNDTPPLEIETEVVRVEEQGSKYKIGLKTIKA